MFSTGFSHSSRRRLFQTMGAFTGNFWGITFLLYQTIASAIAYTGGFCIMNLEDCFTFTCLFIWAFIREVEMHLLTAVYNAHQGRENSQQAEKRLPCSGRWRFSDYYLIIRISSLQCQWLPTLVTTEQSGYFEMTHREPGDICICIWTWICICVFNCI